MEFRMGDFHIEGKFQSNGSPDYNTNPKEVNKEFGDLPLKIDTHDELYHVVNENGNLTTFRVWKDWDGNDQKYKPYIIIYKNGEPVKKYLADDDTVYYDDDEGDRYYTNAIQTDLSDSDEEKDAGDEEGDDDEVRNGYDDIDPPNATLDGRDAADRINDDYKSKLESFLLREGEIDSDEAIAALDEADSDTREKLLSNSEFVAAFLRRLKDEGNEKAIEDFKGILKDRFEDLLGGAIPEDQDSLLGSFFEGLYDGAIADFEDIWNMISNFIDNQIEKAKTEYEKYKKSDSFLDDVSDRIFNYVTR